MDEAVFYVAEGDPADKHSQESIAYHVSVHGHQQHAAFKLANAPQNGAVLTGTGPQERLFVAQKMKALINVYSWGKESIDQRIPVPEEISCLTLVHHPNTTTAINNPHELANFRLPWLLVAGSPTGKLYVWELSSGALLCVKHAHYQGMRKAVVTRCGTFIITVGDDGRCMVWRTIDLISFTDKAQSDVSTNALFHSMADHTLPITDVVLSPTGQLQDLKVYTSSQDGTVREYDLLTKQLVTTFVLPNPVTSLCLDPASRLLYCGLNNGVIRSVPMYTVNKHNQTLEHIGGLGSIVTVSENDPNLEFTFVNHQSNDSETLVTQLKVSLDGTLLISGDSKGRVLISDIISKQVIKSLTSLNSSISFIETQVLPSDFNDSGLLRGDKKHRLIPNLKRILAGGEERHKHELNIQITDEVEEHDDFHSWLAQKSREELEFKNLSDVNSQITSADVESSNSTELQLKLDKISAAYTALRKNHEDLFEKYKAVIND